MAEKKNILTYAGLRKLEDELQELKVVKRKKKSGSFRSRNKPLFI